MDFIFSVGKGPIDSNSKLAIHGSWLNREGSGICMIVTKVRNIGSIHSIPTHRNIIGSGSELGLVIGYHSLSRSDATVTQGELVASMRFSHD